MKKLLLSMLAFLMVIQGFSQKEIISLSFNAKDSITQNPLVLDSVYIDNITLGCDTSLYNPVSDLSINILHVGINDPAFENSASFTVMQNVPNPFSGSTLLRIYLKTDGELNLAVYDVHGKQLSEYHNSFVKGWHMFGVSTSGSQLLFLKVSDNTSTKTIKLLSTGAGAEGSRISYKGQAGLDHPILKSVQEETGFIFYLGNQLQFTAYADGYYESILNDNPESDETYTFAMLPKGFICGTSLTINHVTGAVAPVNKTVTYGTVTNIPGEPTKCWITSNLGADHQATAVNDATEPSAGWYWQFNRKQGYKHTGTVRTPNTIWITSISENSEWATANDPCTIELGAGWRIPTNTEWTNVHASGNWTNWNGPWNSALKMHAAGYLETWNGSLNVRGLTGSYWSSIQYEATRGWCIAFGGVGSFVDKYDKAYGYSLRCLKESSSTTLPTVTTAGITDITQTTATGGGEVTDDSGAEVTARGICWSTSQNPTITDSHTSDETGTGVFVSNLTGLTANTPYFVRAYATNSLGTAYGNELTFTTLGAGFVCGTDLTINHVAGAVAPVTKTTTYVTVTNIPGETSKCWITSNLGSDHQATAKDDATEASAGWYWQFNRKQGYKHTGTVRTPNTTWIYPIEEDFDWLAPNDPCVLELGAGWRIPTNTEWTNVDASGNWTNWNGPWNSALKMHVAGELMGGFLEGRGIQGYYWSSAQGAATYSWYMNFNSGVSDVGGNYKDAGSSIRCIK
ncbi:MAG: hypothetical protein ACOYMF_06880 [Bacteroidales bacterium]